MGMIGIDPGLGGAIAHCWRNNLETSLRPKAVEYECKVWDMPTFEIVRGKKKKRDLDLGTLSDILYALRDWEAFVEQVGAMPGQGVTSMFAFGKAYGAPLGMLAAFQIPMTLVTPQKWKKALGVPKGKDAARQRATQLLPTSAVQWPLKKHDGRAEAALIAYYGLTSQGHPS